MDQAQFREDANVAFRFLGKYGFHELPPEEGRQVDPFLVCSSDGITWVGVKGTNYGCGIDMRLASVDRTLTKEKSYSFDDLMANRHPGFEFFKSKPTGTRHIQMVQMDHYVAALNAHAKDVLKPDLTIFPQVDEAIAEGKQKIGHDR